MASYDVHHSPATNFAGNAVHWSDGHDALESDVSPDDLFHDLDGASAVIDGERWVFEVYSISDRAGTRWIQVGAHGPEWRGATIRLARPCDVPELMAHLGDWIATDAPNGATLIVD